MKGLWEQSSGQAISEMRLDPQHERQMCSFLAGQSLLPEDPHLQELDLGIISPHNITCIHLILNLFSQF